VRMRAVGDVMTLAHSTRTAYVTEMSTGPVCTSCSVQPTVAEIYLATASAVSANVSQRFAMTAGARLTLVAASSVAAGTEMMLVINPLTNNNTFYCTCRVCIVRACSLTRVVSRRRHAGAESRLHR
jgi:hypothetical protein